VDWKFRKAKREFRGVDWEPRQEIRQVNMDPRQEKGEGVLDAGRLAISRKRTKAEMTPLWHLP
jgi:hypothetical protein